MSLNCQDFVRRSSHQKAGSRPENAVYTYCILMRMGDGKSSGVPCCLRQVQDERKPGVRVNGEERRSLSRTIDSAGRQHKRHTCGSRYDVQSTPLLVRARFRFNWIPVRPGMTDSCISGPGGDYPGLCQQPSGSIRTSAAGGPQLPRS